MGELDRGEIPFRKSLQFKVFVGVLASLAAMLAAVLVVFYFRGYELLQERERALTAMAAQRLAVVGTDGRIVLDDGDAAGHGGRL